MRTTYIEDEAEGVRGYGSRFRLLQIVIGIMTCMIVSRLWYLQIIQSEELQMFSEKNRLKETKRHAPRGLILDRDGRVLVENLPGFEVTVSPQHTENLAKTAAAIAPIINVPEQKILKAVQQSRKEYGPFRPARIKDNLNMDEVARLKLVKIDYPGLEINETIIRHYPLSSNGAQLFGYVGEISKRQLERFNKKFEGQDTRFEQGDIIGKGGLEEIWEKQIRGFPGFEFTEVDAHGRLTTTEYTNLLGLKPRDPTPGDNLVLTLDYDVQKATYEAMLNQPDTWGERIGAVVAMKTNGEIISWVSKPSYDPNQFTTGISNDLWTEMVNHPFKPLRNKVIQDHFPPGSSFKPVVALAALQEKVITPNTIIHAPGSMRFGNRTYHDSIRGGHGNVTIFQALERSSNIFFFKMGISLGIDRMAKYAQLLGVGQKTNIGLANERSGLMPTSEWKKRELGEEWQPGENLSNAIGQGFVQMTALQLALVYNTIGMDGKVVRPFVVKQVLDSSNRLVKEFSPEVIRDVSVPQADGSFIEKRHFDTVRKALWRVANGERGTAKWWKVPGVEMAGKTGTSQVMNFSAEEIYKECRNRPIAQRHHGWYIAYAPAENPEITVAALTMHSCHGNTGSAPVVRDVVKAYMEKYHPELLKVNPKAGVPVVIKVPPPPASVEGDE